MKPLEELLAENPLETVDDGKDERGTVAMVAGPDTCPGAAILAAGAALRAGAGRVQLVVAPEVATSVAVVVPEALVVGWDPGSDVREDVRRIVEAADAVVVGPGHRDMDPAAVRALAMTAGAAPVVLDAGALSAASSLGDVRTLVLAPNPDEARKLGADGREEPELAAALARVTGRSVAVRGRQTAVAVPSGDLWVRRDAPPGLGTPGSGDVLMGILGALLARKMTPLASLGWAITIHARAGEILARESPVGYLARDVAGTVGSALADLAARRRSADDQ